MALHAKRLDRASESWPFVWRRRAAASALALAFALTFAVKAGAKPRGEEDFLPPEQAFKPSARVLDERSVELQFEIAPGYYLYREQFRVAASGAALAAVSIPPGEVKFDDTFSRNVQTHRGLLRIAVPVQQASGPFQLSVTYQGCADKGLCYAPTQWQARVSLAAFGGKASLQVLAADGTADQPSAEPTASRAAPPWWALIAAAAACAALGVALLARRRFIQQRKPGGAP